MESEASARPRLSESMRQKKPSEAGQIWPRALRELSFRSLVLFFAGTVCSLVLVLLQAEQRFAPLPVLSTCWVSGFGGTAAVAIGLAYPCVDGCVGQESGRSDWSSVMRCLIVFFGINEASVKIPFEDSRELTLTLALMSLCLWWLFDRTSAGFGLGVGAAFVASSVASVVAVGLGSFSDSDNLGRPPLWLPCIFFAGVVTFGHLGRQLAWDKKKMA